MNADDSLHLQQIREMFAQIPCEAVFRTGYFKLTRTNIQVLDPIDIGGIHLFRAKSSGCV